MPPDCTPLLRWVEMLPPKHSVILSGVSRRRRTSELGTHVPGRDGAWHRSAPLLLLGMVVGPGWLPGAEVVPNSEVLRLPLADSLPLRMTEELPGGISTNLRSGVGQRAPLPRFDALAVYGQPSFLEPWSHHAATGPGALQFNVRRRHRPFRRSACGPCIRRRTARGTPGTCPRRVRRARGSSARGRNAGCANSPAVARGFPPL